MTTSTNRNNILVASSAAVSQLLVTLEQGGLILLPTDTVWCIAADAENKAAVERLLQLKSAGPDYRAELLTSSLPMLKRYASRLHPRLETLLMHHVRPLSIRVRMNTTSIPHLADAKKMGTARVAQDYFCREIIEQFGRPLAVADAAVGADQFPTTFGAIRSDILRGVDDVVRYRQDEKAPGQPSVLVQLTPRLELKFIRE